MAGHLVNRSITRITLSMHGIACICSNMKLVGELIEYIYAIFFSFLSACNFFCSPLKDSLSVQQLHTTVYLYCIITAMLGVLTVTALVRCQVDQQVFVKYSVLEDGFTLFTDFVGYTPSLTRCTLNCLTSDSCQAVVFQLSTRKCHQVSDAGVPVSYSPGDVDERIYVKQSVLNTLDHLLARGIVVLGFIAQQLRG